MRWPVTQMWQTKTRPDTRNSQRRARRPQLENLEGRIVQSILFGAYGNGTFAYNTSNGSWREVTNRVPNVMTEGSSGTLFASFSDGVYRYTYGNNKMVKLTSYTASAMSAASDNTLFATLVNAGTWEYAGHWQRISANEADELAAVAKNRVFGSFSNGLMAYDNNHWFSVTSSEPVAMSATSDGTLFASYNGGGTYKFDGQWHGITGTVAARIEAVSDTSFFAVLAWSGGGGTYAYNNGTFKEISMEASNHVGNDGSTFIADFSTGTWIYQNGHSHKITSNIASEFA